ncbi:zinc carboxypeptidase [Culex quinquefasciatus]|uniref:Zinc carboxypeptidase n=1 Tax=Culex quinquefasciatus TaxID=7176 RepID=B0WTW5_CULQU|nr:zinc carboxypeptidase [Culex quinquefasciatus]|eukprot:XP_001856160.1 zinc carboxypeptidase [Culex quinquefasciatus]
MIPHLLLIVLHVICLGTISSACTRAVQYSVTPSSDEQVGYLRMLEKTNEAMDFWVLTSWTGEEAHVLVPEGEDARFKSDLKQRGIIPTVRNSNITTCGNSNNNSSTRSERNAAYSSKPGTLDFTSRYLNHVDINRYIDYLGKKYPDLVTVTTIGHSYERRPMRTVTISSGKPSKTMIIDAGIHGREWIAPATALYLISQLVQNSNRHRELLANITWIILPLVNPDGYEYSLNSNKFWRKTRRPAKRCVGTDANRNFSFHWGEKGASRQECSQTFAGPKPFSEPETQALRNLLLAKGNITSFYLTLHSYGRFLLYPWGHKKDLPRKWRLLDAVARAGAVAMKRNHNVSYRVGGAAKLLYEASGGSDDFALAVARIPLSITMELPAGGSGESGFHPAESQISRLVEEAFTGIRAMALKMVQMDV